MTETIKNSQELMQNNLNYELQRLQALQKINPAVRAEEIDFIQEQMQQNKHYMDNATLKLQAIRVVVNK